MSEMEVSDVPEATPVAPDAVPVVAQQPSSTPAVEAEVVALPEAAPVALGDAVLALLVLIKDGRRAGDGDVDAAIAVVTAALSATE